jgi:hypothetical protein
MVTLQQPCQRKTKENEPREIQKDGAGVSLLLGGMSKNPRISEVIKGRHEDLQGTEIISGQGRGRPGCTWVPGTYFKSFRHI